MSKEKKLKQDRERNAARRWAWVKSRPKFPACDKCGEIAYLLVRHKDSGVSINNIWRYSQERRDAFLKDCIAICRTCSRYHPDPRPKMIERNKVVPIKNKRPPQKDTSRIDIYAWVKPSIAPDYKSPSPKNGFQVVPMIGIPPGHILEICDDRSERSRGEFWVRCSCKKLIDAGPFLSLNTAKLAFKNHVEELKESA